MIKAEDDVHYFLRLSRLLFLSPSRRNSISRLTGSIATKNVQGTDLSKRHAVGNFQKTAEFDSQSFAPAQYGCFQSPFFFLFSHELK